MRSKRERSSTQPGHRGLTLLILSMLVLQISSAADFYFTKAEPTDGQEIIIPGADYLSHLFYIGQADSVKVFGMTSRSKFFSSNDENIALLYINAADEFVEAESKLVNLYAITDSENMSKEVAITFAAGHGKEDYTGVAGFGVTFAGCVEIFNLTPVPEGVLSTKMYHPDDHPYIQGTTLLGPDDNIGVGFGYASPGVVHNYLENENPLQNLAGNAFHSMDIVASKEVAKWQYVYVVDKTGHFRTIDVTALATGTTPQPKPYVIEKDSVLTAVDQNSKNFNHFLIGHGTGTKGFTLFDTLQEKIINDYPQTNPGDDFEIRVFIGKINHIPESTDLYLSMIAPVGFNDYKEFPDDGTKKTPYVVLVRANSNEFMVSDITVPLFMGFFGGRRRLLPDVPIITPLLPGDIFALGMITDLMVYETTTVNTTLNIKILIALQVNGASVTTFQILKFNVHPESKGKCNSSCATCIVDLPGLNKCLSCPPGEILTKPSFSSEGSCSTTVGDGGGEEPPVLKCLGETIDNCTKCLSSSTSTCMECEDGYGLNANPLNGGTACELCEDDRCLICNKENAGSSCQKCKDGLSVSLKTGLCYYGQLLQVMSVFIILASWLFKR